MHPVLARYLDLKLALEALDLAESGATLDAEQRAFAQAVRASPDQRAVLESARSRKTAPPEAQQALLFVAAHAAARSLADDPAFSAAMGYARQLLAEEGATKEEADQFLASLVLEEAFGYEDEAVRFDGAFFQETLASVEPLARLTSERVQKLIGDFAALAPAGLGATYQAAARAVVDAAWGEGPQPVNPEHLEEALASLSEKLSESERARRFEALRQFLKFLATEGFAGPLRLSRLEQRALATAVELGIPTGGARAH